MPPLDLMLPAFGAAFATAFLALLAGKAAVGAWRVLVLFARGLWWITIGWWFRWLWFQYVG